MSDVQEASSGPSESGEPEPERAKTAKRETSAQRKGRCATHPGEDAVASCDVCGRSLCITCAVPVRGSVVGQECLAQVVEDPPPAPAPRRSPSVSRVLLVGGFALTLGSSILPWARYGDASGMFQAWTVHWSLLAVAASLGGLLLLVFRRRLDADPFVLSVLLVALAALALIGVLMHGIHPPTLSERAPLGWGLAVIGSGAALIGAAAMLNGVVRSEE
jgi:hypothetical protein